jgi:hypothetical protein
LPPTSNLSLTGLPQYKIISCHIVQLGVRHVGCANPFPWSQIAIAKKRSRFSHEPPNCKRLRLLKRCKPDRKEHLASFEDRLATIYLILVKEQLGRLRLVPWSEKNCELTLDVDADNALRRVREYFKENWCAEVHALRWILPDLPSSTRGAAHWLVLHVDELGRLSTGFRENVREEVPVKAMPEELLREATRDRPSEPWSAPEWLASANGWVRAALASERVREVSQVRVCANGAVLRIATDGETYFMKVVPPAFGYEPQLLSILDTRIPQACPPVLPHQRDATTHITRSLSGATLGETDDVDEWMIALRDIATI